MIREDLRRCPFCKGKAYMWKTNYHVYIQCENFCANDSKAHLVQVSADTEDEAIKLWNGEWRAEPVTSPLLTEKWKRQHMRGEHDE